MATQEQLGDAAFDDHRVDREWEHRDATGDSAAIIRKNMKRDGFKLPDDAGADLAFKRAVAEGERIFRESSAHNAARAAEIKEQQDREFDNAIKGANSGSSEKED